LAQADTAADRSRVISTIWRVALRLQSLESLETVMKNKSSLVLIAALLAHGALACGDTVDFDDNGSGGSGASGGNGGHGGDGGSGGKGGQCALYEDESGSEVTFRIVNDSSQAIYLPTNCGALTPTIQPQDGDDGAFYGNRYGGCFASCEDWQQGEPPVCTAEACALTTQRIEPGGSYDFVWQGTGLVQATMPDACYFDATYASGECTQVIEAPEQTYQFDIPGYMDCVGECVCQEDGQCFGEAGGVEGYHDVTTFDHPDEALVEVVFGPCTFGCADPQP
jgi:hypothetical protein